MQRGMLFTHSEGRAVCREWVEREVTVLSKTSQTSKDKYCLFSSPRLKQFFFLKRFKQKGKNWERKRELVGIDKALMRERISKVHYRLV